MISLIVSVVNWDIKTGIAEMAPYDDGTDVVMRIMLQKKAERFLREFKFGATVSATKKNKIIFLK